MPGLQEIYASENQGAPFDISEPGCEIECPGGASAIYQGASTGGQLVFFTSDGKLSSVDSDSTSDLYAYDFAKPEGERLIMLSQGNEEEEEREVDHVKTQPCKARLAPTFRRLACPPCHGLDSQDRQAEGAVSSLSVGGS